MCEISGIYLRSRSWPMNVVVCLLPGWRLCWPHQWRVRITQSFPTQLGIILTKGKNTREEWGAQCSSSSFSSERGEGMEMREKLRCLTQWRRIFLTLVLKSEKVLGTPWASIPQNASHSLWEVFCRSEAALSGFFINYNVEVLNGSFFLRLTRVLLSQSWRFSERR